MKHFEMKLDGVRLETSKAKRETTKPEEFAKAFAFAMWCNRSSAFWLGDILLAGLDLFGDDIWQYLESDASMFDHLERCRGISGKVPPGNRNPDLSWTHHAYVASVPRHKQVEALKYAADEGLNTAQFQSYIAEQRRQGKFA